MRNQGCQIFLGTKYQKGEIILPMIKGPENTSKRSKIDQMAIKYTKIFHCKNLQNLPKLEEFLA
jgi:hypothetical protein